MHTMASRIILALFVLSAVFPSFLHAATEQRTALVIGNSAYSTGPLKNPVHDATDMAATLIKAGFSVTLKKNANHRDMIESIEEFGNTLKRGGVGLFYYAGHGVQVGGVNYLLPVGSRINKEGDVRYEAVDAGRILAEMETANNGLNIVILDACRDNPFGKSVRSSSRGLAIVTHAPTGTFISYSTGAGQVAKDGTGRNSPYTKALLDNIVKPGLSINEVFMNVRSKVKRETGQVPWELSSLEGNFFFIPGKGSVATIKGEASPSASAATDALDEEDRKLETERQRLGQEKAALARQKELDEKRRQLEEEKALLERERKQLAAAIPQRTTYGVYRSSATDAIVLVKKAVAFLQAHGQIQAFAEFNKRDGQFSDMSKDLYVWVFDMEGRCLSHGANEKLIGRDLSRLKDSDGKYFIKEILNVAKTKGKGWIDYNWSNPTTKRIVPKSSYVEKVSDNMLIGCGIYR